MIQHHPNDLKLDDPIILLTGANGWLGGRVARALTVGLPEAGALASGGKRVRALVQPGEDASLLDDLGVEVVTGDVRNIDSLRPLFKNAEGGFLVHLAGIIHPAKVSQFEDINTQGTINVVTLAKAAGLRRAVVMSSNSPIGCNPHSTHRFTEESPYNPYMGYGRSKMLMEKALRAEIAGGGEMGIVILRAPWFYGPNQPPRQTLFFQMVKQGRFPIVGSGENRRSMGYVDNLTQGILLAGAHERAVGEVFWLADETPYSMNEIVETVGSVLRDDFGMIVKPNSFHIPNVVGQLATMADSLLQAAGIYQQKIHVLSEMNKTIACDITKARRILGFHPQVALREGMRCSVEWCLRNGQQI